MTGGSGRRVARWFGRAKSNEPQTAEAVQQVAELPPQPDMPPLSARFAPTQDFYRFHFMADGYPGRAEPDGSVFAHPIYGTYVLSDYLEQYAKRSSAELERGIRTVASAALSRMDEFHGALVFWYDADPVRNARAYGRHYSGLTQGYYAVELARAGVALQDESLLDEAARVFASLLIPAEDGGVYFESDHGATIAEVPQEPNSWILNGWMSSLASVRKYAEYSGSPRAREVFESSARSMARLLPLYDEPTLRTSRYGLTGFSYLRLRFSSRPESIDAVTLSIPGEGEYSFGMSKGSRWQAYVFDDDLDGAQPVGSVVRMNAVLSLASAPALNTLKVTLGTSEAGTVVLEGMRGEYDPRKAGPVRGAWIELGRSDIDPQQSHVSFSIPVDFTEAAVYPTNFVKKVDGHNVNVYHRIHIRRLREIGAAAGLPEMIKWADRWAEYIEEWPAMPIYDGLAMRKLDTGVVVPLSEWNRA